MFKVKALGQNNKNNIPVDSGVLFGFWDKPIFFEVCSEEVEKPLTVEFILKRDKSRSDLEIDRVFGSNNQVTITCYNPQQGTGGLTNPIGIANTGDKILGFMFYVDTISDSPTYRITYEFYCGYSSSDYEEENQ